MVSAESDLLAGSPRVG
uniref:Uncharacterized protein n=1 Tax=Nothobranchius korthausae TaxID=1143690 RepID=A0A1A8GFM1_9TELE